MKENYRCSMVPGMPAEPVTPRTMTTRPQFSTCSSCKSTSDYTPAQDKDFLMRQIMEAGFALDDAVLFLDTHPGDRDALRYYQAVRDLRDQTISAYEAQFGPLKNGDVVSSSWDWVTEKWPWEGGC